LSAADGLDGSARVSHAARWPAAGHSPSSRNPPHEFTIVEEARP